MSLKTLIAGSYGTADNIFAGHPNDCERARQSLVEAGNENIGFTEFLKMHEDYLKAKGCDDAHIKEQLKRVKRLDNYFDYD
jgi:hypothetical protein